MTKNEVKLNFPLKQGDNVVLSVTEDGKAIEISAPVDGKIEQALADSKEYTDTKVEELKNDPDIVNIVETKEDLDALSDNYLAGLGNNDIIRVLQSSEGGSRGYYKWHKTIPQPTQPPFGYFEFVGDVDDYYSKEESDEKFSTIEETEIIKSRLDNVEDLADELSDTKLDKVEDEGSSELVYAQQTGVQKMITAEVVEEPNSLIKRSANGTAFIQVPTGNDIDPLYIANVGYVDSKTVVINSSSYTTLDDSETTDVPALTVEQVTTIYNAIVAGKKVYVRDNSGNIEILFTERERNITDDILTVGCTYMGKLTLSYSIVGETVQVSYKEIGQGGGSVSEWGDIGGNIENQTDLMEELNKKIEAEDSFITDPLDNRYLKDATVSNGTLTLTKQDNTTVEFQSGEDSGYTDIIRTSEELDTFLRRTPTTTTQSKRVLIKSGTYMIENSDGYTIPRDVISITGEMNTVINISEDWSHSGSPLQGIAFKPYSSTYPIKFKNLKIYLDGFMVGFSNFRSSVGEFDNVEVHRYAGGYGMMNLTMFSYCNNIHNMCMTQFNNYAETPNLISFCANVYNNQIMCSSFQISGSVLSSCTNVQNNIITYECYSSSGSALTNCRGVKNNLVEFREQQAGTQSGYSGSYSVQTGPSYETICADTANGGFNVTIHTQI